MVVDELQIFVSGASVNYPRQFGTPGGQDRIALQSVQVEEQEQTVSEVRSVIG